MDFADLRRGIQCLYWQALGRLHKPYEIIITTVRSQLELNAQSAHALNLIITRVTVSKYKPKHVVKAVLEFLQYSTNTYTRVYNNIKWGRDAVKYFSPNVTADLLSLATCSWPRAMTPSFTKRSSIGTAECVVENTYTYTYHEETNKTLLQNFGIDVDKDQPNIHSKVFCLCCRHIYCYEGHSVFRALVVRSVAFSKSRKREGDQEKESWTAALPTCCEQDPASCNMHIVMESVFSTESFSFSAINNSAT